MTSPLEIYSKFVLSNHFDWPNPEIGRKIANGRLLFQAMNQCVVTSFF